MQIWSNSPNWNFNNNNKFARRAFSKIQYFHCHTYYSDNTKILNFYGGSTFTFQIALYVPIVSFLSKNPLKLWLKLLFSNYDKSSNFGVNAS